MPTNLSDYSGFRAGAFTVTDDGQYATNPFQAAIGYTDEAFGFVEEQIAKAVFNREEYYKKANEVFGDLADWSVDFNVAPTPPTNPELDFDFAPDFQPVDPAIRTDFGDITVPNIDDAPTVDGIGTIVAPTIPNFNPSITGLAIPEAPSPILVATPGDPPEEPTLVFPPAPDITLPDQPDLADINIPTFAGIELPTFDPTYPEFEGTPVNAVLNWVEPTYSREIIDEAMTQIRTFLAGGSGVDPEVEEALVARGRDREDRLVRQNEQQATEEWANRGYTAPPGLLVQRIDSIREEGLLKKLGLNREMVLKVHEDELANLRFAVQQGIAAEQLFIQLFLAATERLFEAQRLTVQWQIDIYNIMVALFNAKMQEVQIRAQVFETQVRAELAEVEVFKALVDAELAKAQVNQSLVEMYRAEIQARESLVNIYEAQIRAVNVQAEVYATRIQGFRGKVEAYAAEVAADKTRFDAYESRVRGETAKASLVEAEARAYQATVQGIETGVRAETAALQGQIARVEAEIRAYEANVQGKVQRAQIELSKIEQNVRGFAADVQRYIAEVGLEEARERTETAAWEAGLRSKIAFFEAQIARYNVDLTALTEEARLSLGAITAAGDLASTIIAGSMAAMHVGATMSGSGAVQASGSDGVQFSRSWGCNQSKSISVSFESPTEPPDPSCAL